MKNLTIFLMLIILLLPLGGCGYSQEDIDNAYQDGYDEGYTQGQEDAVRSPLFVVITDEALGELTQLSYGFDINDYYHKPECEVYQWYLDAFEAGFEGEKSEAWFYSAEEAEAAGYSPCPYCLEDLTFNY